MINTRLDQDPSPITRQQWSELWWKWRLPILHDESPGYFEFDRRMIFLPGSFGNNEHVLRIQYGRIMFFPIIVAINSNAEDPSLKTDQDLIDWAKHDVANINNHDVYLNDIKLADQGSTISNVFETQYPQPNRFNAKAGITRAISAGFWFFLRSEILDRDNRYQIHTTAACLSGKLKINSLYNITFM